MTCVGSGEEWTVGEDGALMGGGGEIAHVTSDAKTSEGASTDSDNEGEIRGEEVDVPDLRATCAAATALARVNGGEGTLITSSASFDNPPKLRFFGAGVLIRDAEPGAWDADTGAFPFRDAGEPRESDVFESRGHSLNTCPTL